MVDCEADGRGGFEGREGGAEEEDYHDAGEA